METLKIVLSDVWGWCTALVTFLISFLGDGADCVIYLIVATTVDLGFGIARSWKQGVKPKSKGLSPYLQKIVGYIALAFALSSLDKVIGSDSYFISRAITCILMAGEIWSILSNMSIIYPNLQTINLVKKLLASEIADKINIDKGELEKTLDNADKDTQKVV